MIKQLFSSAVLCLGLTFSAAVWADDKLSKLLNSQVSVAGQMTEPKFSALLKQGFKSVIVNRPDQETGNAAPVNTLREIAERSHVSVIYQPVISGKISQTDIEEFAKYYNELPKPVLLICRSGSRSTALFQQAQHQGLLHE
ncbi:beta-lactamase hydrolase domain-containing protein [Acinetobacter tianfuensis]|uniref:Beta-lactamase hydrolase-like protein phosphatase-like domain-containing protein n=1 Tax=Acinetobacter tianfuensis TaxID=2419603 RepID=A0A3A8E359_9GAMM|nr:sulfur transferase domain-containing protein [Acinetobacter tianfuensis]RKG29377.1 hypothetical protein D7V32_15385 [Acinetobacter tianfuensis]